MPSYLEPTWGEPTVLGVELNTSHLTPRSPSVVGAGLVSLLRAHFGSAERIFDRRLSDHLWSPGNQSRLIVCPALVYAPGKAGNSPAVVVSPGRMRVQSVALGDRLTPHMDADGRYRGKDKVVLWSGEHKVLARGPLPLQAQLLSEEVAYAISTYADEYADSMALSKLRVSAVEPVSARSQEDGGSYREYMAPVGVEWSVVHDWTVSTRGPTLRRGGLALVG